MSTVKARVEKLERFAPVADDWSDMFDTITVHCEDGPVEMTQAQWQEYRATHPGDYITLYEFGDE